jgi:alpha-L-fucosidase 2
MIRRLIPLGLTLAAAGVLHAAAPKPSASPSPAPTRPPAATAPAPLADAVDWAAFLARNDLTWSQPPINWIEGPFVGNGLLGAMIYHDPKDPQTLRLDLSRSDLYNKAGLGGIRVPTGHLELKPVGKITGVDYRLNLHDAEAVGTVRTDQGEVRWRAYVHADEPFLRLETTATGGEVAFTCTYVQERAFNTRPGLRKPPEPLKPTDTEPEPSLMQEGPLTLAWQPFNGGGGAATVVRQQGEGAARVYTAAIAVGWTDDSPKAEARQWVATPQATEGGLASHRAWWHRFYQASFVSVPDARLESFYWIQLYKLGSATRADRPAMDLMGPWYQRSVWLAYWMNLNIQLAYWPVYAANQPELGESLTRWVAKYQENLTLNAPKEWQADSAYLPRVTGPTLARGGNGSPLKPGGELGNLPFLVHNLYLHYRYTMDETLLREVVYPLLTRSVNFYRHNFITGADGRYHLPLATSPEYETLAEDTNYDLSLCRWACETLLSSAARLKIDDPLIPVWKDILVKLTPYPENPETGYLIGAKVPLEHSHRHFSHLFMVYPLATVDILGADRPVVERSIRHWLGLSKSHQGYSYTGGASMAAYLGDGDQALERLNRLFDRYMKSNTFYVEAGLCPVIETPLSGARSLQDMLLQSWGPAIRVFPGVPTTWKDAVFRDLRTEGAFLVSAVRRDGATRWVRVQSLAGEPCRLITDLKNFRVTSSRPLTPQPQADGSLVLPLAKGDWVELHEAVAGAGPIQIQPVARTGPDNAWGTLKIKPAAAK